MDSWIPRERKKFPPGVHVSIWNQITGSLGNVNPEEPRTTETNNYYVVLSQCVFYLFVCQETPLCIAAVEQRNPWCMGESSQKMCWVTFVQKKDDNLRTLLWTYRYCPNYSWCCRVHLTCRLGVIYCNLVNRTKIKKHTKLRPLWSPVPRPKTQKFLEHPVQLSKKMLFRFIHSKATVMAWATLEVGSPTHTTGVASLLSSQPIPFLLKPRKMILISKFIDTTLGRGGRKRG